MDAKPDKKLAIPNRLEDLQALLDNIGVMNQNYNGLGEIACDDYYLDYENWESSRDFERDAYIWQDEETIRLGTWSRTYQTVFFANEVLDQIKKIKVTSSNKVGLSRLKGGALFFRAYAFYDLTQIFTLPYMSETADQQLGIPLRLTSDINEGSERSSLQETYDRIIRDLIEAAYLLPATVQLKYHPSKAAAFGALARAYLAMGEYGSAGKYADSALQINSDLIDFNTLDSNVDYPITYTDQPQPSAFEENEEIIFYSKSPGGSILKSPVCKIDSLLYRSYKENDLRRSIYFKVNDDRFVSFKGYYDGIGNGTFFNGITTDELYLTRAECYARAEKIDSAMKDLDTLLNKRYRKGTFVPLSMPTATKALQKILLERRKELVFRGLRWADLRRLSTDQKFATSVRRNLNGKIYELKPGDPKYAFPIPEDVIQTSGIQQNKR